MQSVSLLVSLIAAVHAVSWLSLGMTSSQLDPLMRPSTCRRLSGLNRPQIRFCRNHTDLMPSIQIGTRTAYAECQWQFQKRRWNCTMLDPSSSAILGDVLLSEATRESAFVHAITAAGVAYKVTKDCARGLHKYCGCDQSTPRKQRGRDGRDVYQHSFEETKNVYEYDGCSDNVHYGIEISRKFVDSADANRGRNGSERAVLNLHNNRAGREVLERSLRKECKCHGVSGSCQVRTCWNTLPPFREIGSIIKDKFDGAAEVQVLDGEDEWDTPRIVMKNTHFKRHTNADLVYMAPSPDFCDADPVIGILGTRGRECDANSQGIDGCQLMCCGRGHETRSYLVTEKCHCKFIYCCRVECQTCTHEAKRHFCL